MKEPHIVLIGMMGCGKSSVGRKLSQLTKLPLFDTDEWVEEISGCTVSDIFKQYGEAEFRRLEQEAVKHIAELPTSVISTGGGIVQNAINRSLLWQQGNIFYLQASIDTLLNRAVRRPTRPLLQQANPRQILEELMARRESFYNQAHHIIPTDKLTIEEIAHAICKLYRNRDSAQKSSRT